MLKFIRNLFDEARAQDAGDAERPQHLAAAVLMFEVAKADHDLAPEEVARLETVLQQQWSLSPDELAELTAVARDHSELAASLHEQVDLINATFDNERKLDLLTGLWRVACADGAIHHHEEHLVRRLAELLHLPHREFIRCKHRALAES